jgi:PadR family transcriptional regulator, regulatory protein PadR
MEVKLTQRTIAVLAELLTDPARPRYGLEVSRESGVRATTVYDILMKLEHHGWVQSEWETVDPAQVGRPRRRLYRLTGRGASSARAEIESEIGRLRRGVGERDSHSGFPVPSAAPS